MFPFAVSDSQPNAAMLSASAEVGSAATAAETNKAGNEPANRAIRFCMSVPFPSERQQGRLCTQFREILYTPSAEPIAIIFLASFLQRSRGDRCHFCTIT